MVPGIFPSQLVIFSTGQTYFETCYCDVIGNLNERTHAELGSGPNLVHTCTVAISCQHVDAFNRDSVAKR